MRYVWLLAVLAVGCVDGVQGYSVSSDVDTTLPAMIRYAITAPYQLSGSSPAGNDGFVYSVFPAAPLAADPWQLVFCYQSACINLQQPLEFIPVGEMNVPLAANGTLSASGSVSCSNWVGGLNGSRITWYDATPLHWHIAIDAICADGSFSVRGDWRRID